MAHRDLLLANARVVLAERVIEAAWVAAVNGGIVEIGEGRAPDQAEDLAGDLLLPGLVELHTDHLEAHYVPRPKVHWDPVAAVVSYDGQLAPTIANSSTSRARATSLWRATTTPRPITSPKRSATACRSPSFRPRSKRRRRCTRPASAS